MLKNCIAFVLGASLVGVLAALIFLTSTEKLSIKEGVERALQERKFVQLTPKERADLERRLARLVAGIHLKLALNEPFQKDHFNVFITLPTTVGLTGCGQGNAVYNSQLDCIFMDRAIAFPTRVQSTFAASMIMGDQGSDAASRTYFDYVVLHELGHRTLHAHLRKSFDSGAVQDSIARRIEAEADSYAIFQLNNLDSSQKSQSQPLERTLGRFKEPTDAAQQPEDITGSRLGEMAYELSRSMLFAEVPYSPFTSDYGHPAFVNRMEILLQEVLSHARAPKAKTFAELAGEHLRRIGSVRERLVCELHLDEPILRMDWVGGDLIVISHSGDQCRLPAALFQDMRPSENVPVYRPTPERRLSSEMVQSLRQAVLRSLPSGATIAVVPKRGVLNLDSLSWVDVETNVSPKNWQAIATAGQKWIAYSQTNGQTVFELFNGLKYKASVDQRDLIAGLAKFDVPKGAIVQLMSSGETFFALIYYRNPSTFQQQLVGFARLNDSDLTPEAVIRLNTGPPLDPDAASRGSLTVISHDGHEQAFLVIDTFEPYGKHRKPYEIEVWQLLSDLPPKLVAHNSYALDVLPTTESPFDWLNVSHPPVLSCRSIDSGFLCDAWIDSIYSFEMASNRLSVLFHPPEVWLTEIGHNLIAAYSSGGYKCYVLKTTAP